MFTRLYNSSASQKLSLREKRLCRKIYGTNEPEIYKEDEPDGIQIDQTAQGQQIVQRTGSAFFREVMFEMQDMTLPEDMEEVPAFAYMQLVNEEAWIDLLLKGRTFSLPQSNIPLPFGPADRPHMVQNIWYRIAQPARRHLLVEYFSERLTSSAYDALSPIDVLKNSNLQVDLDNAVLQLLALREYQRTGELQPGGIANVHGNLIAINRADDIRAVENSVRSMYLSDTAAGGTPLLTLQAYNDFFAEVDPSRPAQQAVFNIGNYNDVLLNDVIDALPESSIKGALRMGVISKEQLKKLIEFYHEKKGARERTKSVAHSRLSGLQQKLEESKAAEIVAGRVVELPPEARAKYASDHFWNTFNDMPFAGKATVSVIGAALGYVAINRLTRDRSDDASFLTGGGRDLMSLGALGVGAWFMGGDKFVRNMGGDEAAEAGREAAGWAYNRGGALASGAWSGMQTWAPGPAGVLSSAGEFLQGGGAEMPALHVRNNFHERGAYTAEDKQYLRSFANYMERHLKEHNEDMSVHQFGSGIALGAMQLRVIGNGFNSWNGGKDGIFIANPEIQTALRMKFGPGAQEIIDNIHDNERQWGDFLAHACYLYAMHKSPERRFFQRQQTELEREMNRRGVNTAVRDPLEMMNDYDTIGNPGFRRLYESAVHAGASAMMQAPDDMTLADFIVSINSIPEDFDRVTRPDPKPEKIIPRPEKKKTKPIPKPKKKDEIPVIRVEKDEEVVIPRPELHKMGVIRVDKKDAAPIERVDEKEEEPLERPDVASAAPVPNQKTNPIPNLRRNPQPNEKIKTRNPLPEEKDETPIERVDEKEENPLERPDVAPEAPVPNQKTNPTPNLRREPQPEQKMKPGSPRPQLKTNQPLPTPELQREGEIPTPTVLSEPQPELATDDVARPSTAPSRLPRPEVRDDDEETEVGNG